MLDPRFKWEWLRCEPMLRATYDYWPNQARPFEQFVADIALGTLQFWPAEDSAALTEIVTLPYGVNELQIVCAGGKMATMEASLGDIEAFAAVNGCVRVRFWGRKGWTRFGQRLGYTITPRDDETVWLTKEVAGV